MKNYLEYFDSCVFAFESKNNVMEDKELGITSSISSLLTPEDSVAHIRQMQACPYTATGMSLDVLIGGAPVRCSSWRWLPTAILRRGEYGGYRTETLTTLIHGGRGALLKISVENTTDGTLVLPIQAIYKGCSRHNEVWNFCVPEPAAERVSDYFDGGWHIGSRKDGCAMLVTSSLEGMKMFPAAYLWEGEITVAAGETRDIYFSVHIGPEADALAEAERTRFNYENLISGAFDYLHGEVLRIEKALPRLKSDNPRLDAFYYRSLVTYILCRWENPELCVSPYFSTGSVNGACMCSYLWDWCGGLMLHPVYDPVASKRQITSLLKNDLTKSYALNPVTAGPLGPWYQVNQEKISLMVYHHVLTTGDKDFLFERVNGRTVIDHMIEQAYVCDDLSGEVQLYDYGIGTLEPRRPGWRGADYIWYGEGNAHLELRNGYTYHGIIPDLNARRYMNYMRVYELTKIAGVPDERLPRRAAALKEKLRELWCDSEKWYYYEAQGKRELRYTVQMFKFLNSPVIGEEERCGLISHLNEREFLSRYGLHSLSKADPAYDQDDIDNGGGGICTHFANQVCAQLYETGYDTEATDILKRILWWGERLPYLGDSCVAGMMLNNEITPLQGDISSVSGAQMIFYYIFGIKPDFDGNIRISPVKVRPAENMRVDNARLCGKVFSVDVRGDVYSVEIDGKSYSAKVGEEIII